LKEARTVRILVPILKMYRWALPATIFLGILSSFAEGVGISLFVPLLQSLDRKSYQLGVAGGLQGILDSALKWVPPSAA
jgi:subfamily B ATP-binding cassette protein MsbA